MPRVRKPSALLEGHYTKEEQKQRQMEEELARGDYDNIKPPSWLTDKIAKKEFKRLAEELLKLNIMCNLDVNNLASYCESYSKYVQATKELKGQPLTIQKQMNNGSYTMIENPLIKIQKSYADEMRKFAVLCGLSLNSRLQFATVKIEQSQEIIQDEFGDI